MKKFKFILIAVIIAAFAVGCGCPNSATAQTTTKSEIVTLDLSTLPPSVQNQIKQNIQTTDNLHQLEQYSKWAGLGEEVGVAVSSALNAVVDVADKFGKTRVGEITIALVVWKVAGKDVVQIIVGFILFTITIIFVSKSYFRTFSRRKLTSRTGWWIFGKRTYETTEADDFWDNPNTAALMHVVVMLAMWGISAAIMFG